MMKYSVARLFQAVPTLTLLSIISFLLIHVVPGGPAVVMLGDKATPALVAQINRSLGLNKPLWMQYGIWLGQLLRGNLGYAYSYHQSVASLIAINLPRTLILVVTAIAISHVIAIIVGIYQAAHRDQPIDHMLTALLYFLYAMPTFWLGVLMVSIFSITLGWFPSGGLYNPLLTQPTIGSYVDHLILPASVLVIGSVAGWGRYMRSSMSETLVQDYIRTARAKGLSARAILGPVLYRASPYTLHLTSILKPPSAGYPLGTNNLGRNMLARLMLGGQTSLEVGFAAAVSAMAIGIVYGLVAGYVGGWVDAVMMRFVDLLRSIPGWSKRLVLVAPLEAVRRQGTSNATKIPNASAIMVPNQKGI